MVVAWIVITLMIALVVGVIMAGLFSNDGDAGTGFFFGFVGICQLSFVIGVIYVAAHFISKYW